MKHIPLTPPFDRRLLLQIAARAQHDYGLAADHTVDWLLSCTDSETMAASLRALWSASTLPLSKWANAIKAVTAVTNEESSYLSLEVELGSPHGHAVCQQAPLPSAVIESCLARFPQPLPKLLVDIARTCPGLVVDSTGMITSPTYMLRPLEYVHEYLRFQSGASDAPAKWSRLNAQAKELLVEIADDGQGNCFILGRDGGLYFFDHLECDAFDRCRIGPDEFLLAYFDDPGCVFDYEFVGRDCAC